MYTILSDLSVIWEFKLLYPLFFSLISLAIYYAVRSQFGERAGASAALVYVYSHPFFALLAVNTRTGQALLFVAIFILVALDDNMTGNARSLCLVLSFFGVLFSHYAVAPLFLFVLCISWVVSLILQRCSISHTPPFSTSLLSISIVSLVTWYLYVAKGVMIKSLSEIFVSAITGLLSGSQAGEAGTNSISLQLPSYTYYFIRYEYLFILAICGMGVLACGIALLYPTFDSPLRDKFSMERSQSFVSGFENASPWMLSVGVGGALIVPMSFLPGVSFGIARVYMIVMLFLAGFGGATLFQLANIWPRVRVLIIFFLSIMLIINSGVGATVVTNDVSPQPNLLREHIVSSGSDAEAFHLWRRWNPKSDWEQAEWTQNYIPSDQTIYRGKISHMPMNPPPETDRVGGGPRGQFIRRNGMCDGYVYLTTFDYRVGEVMVDPNPDFIYYDKSVPLDEIHNQRGNKVYSSGNNTIDIQLC
jgi:uncharacterized membrane protein